MYEGERSILPQTCRSGLPMKEEHACVTEKDEEEQRERIHQLFLSCIREKQLSRIKPVEETPLRNEEHAQVTENDVVEKRDRIHQFFLSCISEKQVSHIK